MPIGTFGATDKEDGVVGVNTPSFPILKPATSSPPLFATYRNSPVGLIVTPMGAEAASVQTVAADLELRAPWLLL